MDIIVYTLVTNPGGVDGLDFMNKGGTISAVAYDRKALENHPNKPWCEIIPIVIDKNKAKTSALAKLDKIDRLILGI